ncbi:MAG: hypothetical protein V6Z82_06725 [Flavobacteriales bacterium]
MVTVQTTELKINSKFYGYSIEDFKKGRDDILERRNELQPVDESDWLMEGTGSGDANAFVGQLFNSLYSIKVENTSVKLRTHIKALLNLLVGLRVLKKTQTRKSSAEIYKKDEAIKFTA